MLLTCIISKQLVNLYTVIQLLDLFCDSTCINSIISYFRWKKNHSNIWFFCNSMCINSISSYFQWKKSHSNIWFFATRHALIQLVAIFIRKKNPFKKITLLLLWAIWRHNSAGLPIGYIRIHLAMSSYHQITWTKPYAEL